MGQPCSSLSSLTARNLPSFQERLNVETFPEFLATFFGQLPPFQAALSLLEASYFQV